SFSLNTGINMSLLAATKPQKKKTEISVIKAERLVCMEVIFTQYISNYSSKLILKNGVVNLSVLIVTLPELIMQLLTPSHFSDYELLDCGDFEKLERFGKYITIRPEPQAVWPKIYSNADWEKQAHI